MALLILITITVVPHLAFAQEDKKKECQNREANILSKTQQWLIKRHSFLGGLDLNGSLRADEVLPHCMQAYSSSFGM
jgi:hypothetical protein